MIFTKEAYELIFDGYIIKGCAIRNSERQIYLLVEDNDEKIKNGYLPEHRFLYTYNEYAPDPKECFFTTNRNHLNLPEIAYNINGNELIGVDMSGNLYSHSAGNDRKEDNLSQKLKGSDYNGILMAKTSSNWISLQTNLLKTFVVQMMEMYTSVVGLVVYGVEKMIPGN